MSTITEPHADPESTESPTNHRLRRDRDRASLMLRRIAWSAVPASAALAVALIVDDRVLLGESVWAKPLKFTISVGLTGAATSWLVNRLTPSRVVTAAAIAASVSLVGEQALIILQAARGVRSHFNIDTPFDRTVLSTMGALVLVAAGTLVTLAVASTRRPPDDETTRAVVIGGSWLVVLGSVAGAVMVAANAHSIGGPDGSPGLPILGWNRSIGDLRPAHFLGLHGLQLLIATAALAQRAGWATRPTAAAVRSVTAATAAASAGLLVQALAGKPIVSRSTLLVAAVGAAAATASKAHRSPRRARDV
jgi:hypothetical protein